MRAGADTARLEAVRELRLKLKAARALIRDLAAAAARAEEALEAAQPEEAQRTHDQHHLTAV